MKKIIALLLAFVLTTGVLGFALAEETETDQDQEQELESTISADDLVLENETYSAWFDLAWPIVRNYYVQATWITYPYFRTNRYNADTAVNLDFLLVEDALALTKDQATRAGKLYTYLEESYPVSKYSEGSRGKVLVYTYNLLHSAPTVLDKLVELHDGITIPAEYTDFDSIVLNCISNLKSVSDKTRNQISDAGTISDGWDSGLNRSIFEQIDAINRIMR